MAERREQRFHRKAKLISDAADSWHTSQRLAAFAAALGRMAETSMLSESERRDLGRLARWTKGYAERLDPIPRFESLAKDFRGEQEE